MGHMVGSAVGAESVHEVHEDKLTGEAWWGSTGETEMGHIVGSAVGAKSEQLVGATVDTVGEGLEGR